VKSQNVKYDIRKQLDTRKRLVLVRKILHVGYKDLPLLLITYNDVQKSGLILQVAVCVC